VPAGAANPATTELAAGGVHVAERGGTIRVGAHIFNDEQDVDRFATVLRHTMAAR
jgi:selenocysteine lyase/cysteine desulfurase